MYKAYVISLTEPKQLLKELPKYSINPIWVEGVNGKKLTKQEIQENTGKSINFIPVSAIGIAMSHIKVWKEFLKTGDQYAIIFEDDVLLEDDFAEMFQLGIDNVPNDYDLLYLGCFGCQSKYNYHTLLASLGGIKLTKYKKINKYITQPILASATHGYVVSRKGAKILIDNIDKNINDHVDAQMQKLYFNGIIKEYVLNKRIAYQSSTDNLVSTNTTNSHPYILNKMLSKYYLDTKLRANYDLSMSRFSIANFNVTAATALFFLIGLVVLFEKWDIINVTIFYLILSSPDILYMKELFPIFIHYLLLVGPSVINNMLIKNQT